MKKHILIIKDFFEVALGTWVILLAFELVHPGMVYRLINLEYYFYFLIVVYFVYRLIKK